MAKIDAFDGSMTEEEYHELADMADALFQKSKPLDPNIARLVNKNFWKLI